MNAFFQKQISHKKKLLRRAVIFLLAALLLCSPAAASAAVAAEGTLSAKTVVQTPAGNTAGEAVASTENTDETAAAGNASAAEGTRDAGREGASGGNANGASSANTSADNAENTGGEAAASTENTNGTAAIEASSEKAGTDAAASETEALALSETAEETEAAAGTALSALGTVSAQATTTGETIVALNITIQEMLQLQKNKGSKATLDDLDPNQRTYLSVFADLTQASGLSAAQLDAYIDSTAKGRSGSLHGMGYAFVKAEQTYGLSAVYLLAHAILESGWGTSTLSKGYAYDGSIAINGTTYAAGTYYNFFGIGAYDGSALSGGRSKAVQAGWNSREAAILGGAQWIAENYLYRSQYPQKTIYAMRWDYDRANATGSCWHQYATSLTWADSIARLMDNAYTQAGTAPAYSYIYPLYKGWSIPVGAEGSMYRMYNPNSGEHFYTASATERNNLVVAGWSYEGVGWMAPDTSSTPVYRLYNPNPGPNGSGEHHYTTSLAEKELLVSAGWQYEGIGWYSDDAQGVAVYRQYNQNQYNCNHNFTASKAENDYLVGLGWQEEGIAWYGIAK